MSRHVPSPISGRSIDRAGVRCDCKFNPLALGQIQNGADIRPFFLRIPLAK
jgi:hypothetical protein